MHLQSSEATRKEAAKAIMRRVNVVFLQVFLLALNALSLPIFKRKKITFGLDFFPKTKNSWSRATFTRPAKNALFFVFSRFILILFFDIQEKWKIAQRMRNVMMSAHKSEAFRHSGQSVISPTFPEIYARTMLAQFHSPQIPHPLLSVSQIYISRSSKTFSAQINTRDSGLASTAFCSKLAASFRP